MTSSILFEPLLTKPLHNSQFSHHWWGLHPAQACRSRGMPVHCSVMASQFWTDQLTYISTRGTDFAHRITTGPPRIFRPSYSPAAYKNDWASSHPYKQAANRFEIVLLANQAVL